MTLKRLMIALLVLMLLVGGGIAWLWEYAYSIEGRARVIITQLKGDTTSLRGWLLKHELIRAGYIIPARADSDSSAVIISAAPTMNVEDQKIAAESMVKLGPEVLPVAIEALQDGNLDVELMAVRVCGTLGEPAAIKPIADFVRNKKGKLPAGRSEFIGELSEDDPQFLCLEAMVKIGPEAGEELISITALFGSHARQAIVAGTSEKWDRAALPVLIHMLDDPEGRVRAGAALELAEYRKDATVANALYRHLDDEDHWTALHAAKSLARESNQRAVKRLLTFLSAEVEPDRCQFEAARTLAAIGRDEGSQFIAKMSRSPKPSIRRLAARSLRSPVNNRTELLLSLLQDCDSGVRISALQSAVMAKDRDTVPAIKKLLADADPEVRKIAEEAMKELGQ